MTSPDLPSHEKLNLKNSVQYNNCEAKARSSKIQFVRGAFVLQNLRFVLYSFYNFVFI